MRISKQLLLALTLFALSLTCKAQNTCCNDSACRQRATELRDAIIPLLSFVGNAVRDDDPQNKIILENAHQRDPAKYNRFRNVMYELIAFTRDNDHDLCFQSLVTSEEYIAIGLWRIYFNDLKNPVSFPSPEFCSGFGIRLELAQGSAAFLRNDMAYLGAARGFLSYTIGRKESCGNRVRVMTGPALFLFNNTPYVVLNSRLAYRLSDIMIDNPPVFLGNWNLFGEYVSNFQKLHQAGLGIEAQLGKFGVNFSVTHDFRSDHQGFLFGLFYHSKKKKRS